MDCQNVHAGQTNEIKNISAFPVEGTNMIDASYVLWTPNTDRALLHSSTVLPLTCYSTPASPAPPRMRHHSQAAVIGHALSSYIHTPYPVMPPRPAPDTRTQTVRRGKRVIPPRTIAQLRHHTPHAGHTQQTPCRDDDRLQREQCLPVLTHGSPSVSPNAPRRPSEHAE